MDDARLDPSRRALLAALAGGLALVTPAGAASKAKGKGKKTPRPPQAVAIAQLTTVEAHSGFSGESFLDITVVVAGFDLRPQPPLALDNILSFVITAGPAERMRGEMLEEIRDFLASQVGELGADRVQVLLV